MKNNLADETHPNRVTCPKCGKPGTKRSRMVKRGKFNSGPYFYVAHRIDGKRKDCYIGKNWPSSGVIKHDKKWLIMERQKERKQNSSKVKVLLDGESKKMFQTIKDSYKLKDNSETMRFIIKREYDRLEITLRCYKCGKIPEPRWEDREKRMKWNIESWEKHKKLWEERFKRKSGFLPFFSSSVVCIHCGFSNGELTAIGEECSYFLWSTSENIKDIENNLSKACNEFIGKTESTEEDLLRIYKQVIDNFFRTPMIDHFRRAKVIGMYGVANDFIPAGELAEVYTKE